MNGYLGNTAMPGATAQQELAINMALQMVDPVEHDGLRRELYSLLGASGFSDQHMQAALARVLNDRSGVYIPPSLFPAADLTCGAMRQSQTAKISVSANTTLSAVAT
jgi:hypothetical protein